MHRTERLVGVLRVLLALAFAALVVAQLRVLPAMHDDWVRDPSPDLTHPAWLLTGSVLVLLCVQVVVVCTWQLLTMVKDDRIFSDDAMVWVNLIVGAMAAAWVLLLATFLSVLWSGGPAGVPAVLLLLLLVAGAVVGLLMVVMRALLRQATTLRTEMEAVV